MAADDIRAELGRLQVLVDKTAGPREREAMAYVTRHLRAAEGARERVRVEAPARLHLGMLAVAGDGPRRFGGLGVAVGPTGGRGRGAAGRRAVRRGR